MTDYTQANLAKSTILTKTAAFIKTAAIAAMIMAGMIMQLAPAKARAAALTAKPR
jgi:hypothetical protein